MLGVAATFVEAILRLGHRALGALDVASPRHFLVFAVTALVLTYVEGYRALQLRFVPAVLARAARLGPDSSWLWRCLAPLYACALVGAEPRKLLRAWAGVLAIVLAVVVVRALPEPWRAVVDGAVAVALSWGLASLLSELLTRPKLARLR